MKTLTKLAPLLVYALIFTVSIAIAQNPIPIIQQRAYLFEYGHYENNRQDMILDTLVSTTVEIKVYEDVILINSEAKQEYSLGLTLDKQNNDNYYYSSTESIDQDGDTCNIIIHYDILLLLYNIIVIYILLLLQDILLYIRIYY